MRVSLQVWIVYATIVTATLLMAADVALSTAALVNLSRLKTQLMSDQTRDQVGLDMTTNLVISAAGLAALGVLAIVARRPSNKVRVAVWIIAPLLTLSLLCFLIGGPESAVRPTGQEPAALRAEYAQAVPGWYVTLHDIAGILIVACLCFVAVFMTRTDLRDYYSGNIGNDEGHRSWVDSP